MTEGLWRDFPKQPAVFELAVYVRSEDLGKKAWFHGDESEVDEFLDMRILNRLWGVPSSAQEPWCSLQSTPCRNQTR